MEASAFVNPLELCRREAIPRPSRSTPFSPIVSLESTWFSTVYTIAFSSQSSQLARPACPPISPLNPRVASQFHKGSLNVSRKTLPRRLAIWRSQAFTSLTFQMWKYTRLTRNSPVWPRRATTRSFPSRVTTLWMFVEHKLLITNAAVTEN